MVGLLRLQRYNSSKVMFTILSFFGKQQRAQYTYLQGISDSCFLPKVTITSSPQQQSTFQRLTFNYKDSRFTPDLLSHRKNYSYKFHCLIVSIPHTIKVGVPKISTHPLLVLIQRLVIPTNPSWSCVHNSGNASSPFPDMQRRVLQLRRDTASIQRGSALHP